jgi:hypothetical protein
MKYKKRKARLLARIKDWETDRVIQDANRNTPGAFKKPGSLNK